MFKPTLGKVVVVIVVSHNEVITITTTTIVILTKQKLDFSNIIYVYAA